MSQQSGSRKQFDIIQNLDNEEDDEQPLQRTPQKLQKIQKPEFDAHNVPRVECYYHKGQYITNMCRADQCIIPLCPLCIHVHSREHVNEGTYPVFESLEVLLNDIQFKIQSEANRFSASYHDILNHTGNFEGHSEKTIRRLKDIKSRIIEVVEQFFNGLENEIHHKQRKNILNQERDAGHLLRLIKERWESMDDMLNTLSSTKCLSAVIPYYTQTFHEDNISYYRQIDQYINAFPTVSSEIQFNSSKAAELSLYLASIIKVDHTSIPDFIGVHQLPTTQVTESTKKPHLSQSSVKPMRRSQVQSADKRVTFRSPPPVYSLQNSAVIPLVYGGAYLPQYQRF